MYKHILSTIPGSNLKYLKTIFEVKPTLPDVYKKVH